MSVGRLKPGFEDVVQEIESEINCKMEQLNWLPGFYSIPPHVHIARSKAYQQGKVRESNQTKVHLFLCQSQAFIPYLLLLLCGCGMDYFRCTE